MSLSVAPDRSRPLLILLVWLAGLGAAAQFGKVAVALHVWGAQYPVSPSGLGFIVSSVGLCGLVFGVAAGVIVDRFGLRRSIVLGLATGGLLSLLQASLPPYPVLIGLRLVEGAAHLLIVVAGPVLMSAHASERARPAAMTLWSTFFGVSYMLVAFISVPVVARFGPGGLLVGHGIYMLVMAAILWRAMPVPIPRERAPALTVSEWVEVHRRIYRSPWISAPGLGFVFYTLMYVAALAFLPGFVSEPIRPAMASVMPLASIALSLTAGIFVLRFLEPIRVVQLGFALVAMSTIPLLLADTDKGFFLAAVLLMSVSAFCAGGSFASLASLNTDLTDRAHATGALAQMGNVGTSTGAPILAWLIATYGLNGFVGFTLFLSLAGILMHGWLARRRRLSTFRG
ncbi:Cyanate permease [Poseidonocella pacifica]|uniref:Cyanate permease n=1 Tax=Poseidonocella pacifica TaxID=871651 RepID=A0A1I0VJP2_9RHOB|nr:MFS transporter [Poseidonocella pacifica]SFA76247.1 Cyanate permease [Poseidonocella pacifica]